MAGLKPKDLPHEEKALRKRLLFVEGLKNSLQRGDGVLSAALGTYSGIIDGKCAAPSSCPAPQPLLMARPPQLAQLSACLCLCLPQT